MPGERYTVRWRAVVCLLLFLTGDSADTIGQDTCTTPDACRKDGELPTDRNCSEVLRILPIAELKKMKNWWDMETPAIIPKVLAYAGWNTKVLKFRDFYKKFASHTVTAFTAVDASVFQGEMRREVSVAQVMKSAKPNVTAADGPLYAFDDRFFSQASTPAVKVPATLEVPDQVQLLTMGPAGSGTGFHGHGTALLTLFSGQKRWYLQPPGKLPAATSRHLFEDVQYWEQNVLPHLGGSAPISCVQQAGDTIFVPSMWNHATINLKATLGTAWQNPSADSICEHGRDYACMAQAVEDAVEGKAPKKKKVSALVKILEEAYALTEPMMLWGFIGLIWQVDKATGKGLFKRVKESLVRVSQKAAAHTHAAYVVAYIALDIVSRTMEQTGRFDLKEIKEMLEPAADKAPEARVHIRLAELCEDVGDRRCVKKNMKRHWELFPGEKQMKKAK